MKKEIKRKRVNSSTPKKTTRSSRYETKSIKKRVTEKKKLKTKNTILLALLLICIVITIFVYLKVGAIGAIGIGGFLAITLGIIALLVKLKSRGKKSRNNSTSNVNTSWWYSSYECIWNIYILY